MSAWTQTFSRSGQKTANWEMCLCERVCVWGTKSGMIRVAREVCVCVCVGDYLSVQDCTVAQVLPSTCSHVLGGAGETHLLGAFLTVSPCKDVFRCSFGKWTHPRCSLTQLQRRGEEQTRLVPRSLSGLARQKHKGPGGARAATDLFLFIYFFLPLWCSHSLAGKC